jgi:RNA polymerase sigma-70 factor, ECF subfamily
MNSMQDHQRAGEVELETEFLLVLAKAGDAEALGRVLERYRNYIGLLIRLQGRAQLRKTKDSDELFREIGLEIHRRIRTFPGSSMREFLKWVRRVIGSIIANQVRLSRGARLPDVRLERALIDELDRSSRVLNRSFVLPRSTSSPRASRHEPAVILANALEKLPDAYREVIVLRHLEGIAFPEVALRMGRSEDSAKKVWLRALARLRRILEELE